MLSIFLKSVAISEYLLSSCIPAIISCTVFNAILHMIQGVDSLVYFQCLMILLFVEKSIVGVSYKLHRPKDESVYHAMRLIYSLVLLLQILVLINIVKISNIGFLVILFVLKNVFYWIFLCIAFVLKSVPEFSNQLVEYRLLASRLFQYWNHIPVQEDWNVQEEEKTQQTEEQEQENLSAGEENEEKEKDQVEEEVGQEQLGQEEAEKEEVGQEEVGQEEAGQEEVEQEEPEKEEAEQEEPEKEEAEQEKPEKEEAEKEEVGQEEAGLEDEEDMKDAESEEKEMLASQETFDGAGERVTDQSTLGNLYEADVKEFLNLDCVTKD